MKLISQLYMTMTDLRRADAIKQDTTVYSYWIDWCHHIKTGADIRHV